MAEIIFSTDQQAIIDSRNENVLVAAAAGSGKTAVLVERIIRRITDPVNPIDIDKLLVVTFTNAAAGEMKDRITKALDKKLLENPADNHLARQATLVHNAKIMTIDSFCLFLVKNHFHAIGLDPSFRIASEGEIKLLCKDVVKEVIDRAYESGDPTFFRLADSYSKTDNDDSLENCILDIYKFAMSYPWPVKWINEHRGDYSFGSIEEFLKSEMVMNIIKECRDKADALLLKIDEAISICNAGPVQYLKCFNSDKEYIGIIKEALDKNDFEGFVDAFDKGEFMRLPSKVSGSEDDKIYVKALHDNWKNEILAMRDLYAYEKPETLVADMNATAASVNKLFDLVTDFIESFSEAKRDRQILDFTDMEHMAIDILIDKFTDIDNFTVTDVALSYRDYFEEVMIDEYQDSNLVQELILKSVSRENDENIGNRFMVGDVKQSIYRFRLARPQIFIGKQAKYSSKARKTDREIVLKENYRSRKSVIDSVNAVFEDLMIKEYSDTIYTDKERLNNKAAYPSEDSLDNKSELMLIEASADEEKGKLEALAIVNKINSIVGKQIIFDKGNNVERTAGYKDIAILYKAYGPTITALCEAFDRCGIPYQIKGKGDFYSAREICMVMNLLRVIDNPLDDVSLYGLMVSYFGKFTDEEGALIVSGADPSLIYLWDKVKDYFDKTGDEKVLNFINMIESYRDKSVYTPIAELIGEIVDSTGYLLYVSALPDGARRESNVKMLISKASEYARTSFHGLFHFLRYVELMEKINAEEGEAQVLDDSMDCVSIMTIHASKGLEYPVCFLVSAEKQFNTMDHKNPVLRDIDRGVGLKFYDSKKRICRETLMRKYILSKMTWEELSEHIRVLYVAMTRAREKLIVTATVKDVAKTIDGCNAVKTNSYLGLMLPSILRCPKLFDINVYTKEDIGIDEIKNKVDMQTLREEYENAEVTVKVNMAKETLSKRFSFDYPFKGLSRLYTKTTVSELKMAALEDVPGESHNPFPDPVSTPYVPRFAGGDAEVSGTDRGSAYHKLLCLWDFSKLPKDSEELSDGLTKLVDAGKITREEFEIVPKGKLMKFMESPLAKRMSKAALNGKLYKEQPFVIGLPASDVDKDFPFDETILVQGVIDVYFEEDGDIVLMDYKTDRVEEASELISRYETQLVYYQKAIEKLTNLKVKERLIYSFGLNETIVVK